MLSLRINHYETLRAISLCTTDKSDPREALHGIYVEPALGLATATNGYRLFSAKVFEPVDGAEPFVAAIEIPGGRGHFPAVLTSDGSRAEIQTARKTVAGRVIRARFPDYRLVLGDKLPKPNESALHNIGLNPSLLSDVQKALGAAGVALTLTGNNGMGPMQIRFLGEVDLPDGYRFVMMPMRA